MLAERKENENRGERKIKNLSLFPESTKKMDRIEQNCKMLAQNPMNVLTGLRNIQGAF